MYMLLGKLKSSSTFFYAPPKSTIRPHNTGINCWKTSDDLPRNNVTTWVYQPEGEFILIGLEFISVELIFSFEGPFRKN